MHCLFCNAWLDFWYLNDFLPFFVKVKSLSRFKSIYILFSNNNKCTLENFYCCFYFEYSSFFLMYSSSYYYFYTSSWPEASTDTLVIVCTESKPWHWQMDNVLLSLWGVSLMLNCFFCCRVLSTSRTCFLWLCTTVSQKQDLKRPRRVTGFVVRWALYAPVIYLNKSLQISALYTETWHLVPLLMLCYCLSNSALGMIF